MNTADKFRESHKKTFDLAIELGIQAKGHRLERGWTQHQLAQKIGTKQHAISRLENGKHLPSLSFLQKLVDALEPDAKTPLFYLEI